MPVGKIVTGVMGNKAGKMQAKSIEEATRESLAFQKKMYAEGKQSQAPWLQSGGNALNQMNALMGFGPLSSMGGGFSDSMWQAYKAPAQGKKAGPAMTSLQPWGAANTASYGSQEGGSNWWGTGGGTPAPVTPPTPGPTGTASSATPMPWETPEGRAQAQEDAFGAFYTSPGYQFRLNEGIGAIDASAAARGRLLSGSQTKAVQQYGEGMAASEFGDYWNRLAAMSGSGQTSASGNAAAAGAFGQSGANTIFQGGAGAGAARASGYNALGQGIGSGLNDIAAELEKVADKGMDMFAGWMSGGMCWVARAVYGQDNPRWLLFRAWLLNDAPNWLVRLYRSHGEAFARLVRGSAALRSVLRPLMDRAIVSRFGREALHV